MEMLSKTLEEMINDQRRKPGMRVSHNSSQDYRDLYIVATFLYERVRKLEEALLETPDYHNLENWENS